jgi:SAM-dependent methyltransferase
VDSVDEMISRAKANLEIAAELNDWFDPSFGEVIRGDALALPIADGSMDIAGQNCLFNIFTRAHLHQALREMHRVLRPHGALFMSDPVASRPIPDHLAADERLRAECISGAVPLDHYLAAIVEAGFGTIEVRKRVPYRILDRKRYGLDDHLLLESVEICAIKDPIPPDGACIFTGCTATYFGEQETFDDGKGHTLVKDLPLSICDKTARALSSIGRGDIYLTGSTWHYQGGGCC